MERESHEWRQELRALCDRYLQGCKHYWNTIPDTKEANIRRAHRIPSGENIVVLLDHSVTGSAKDGIVITDSALYKKIWWFRYRCPWDAFTDLDIKAKNDNTVLFTKSEIVSMREGLSAYHLAEMLKEIQQLAVQSFGRLKSKGSPISGAGGHEAKVDELYIRELCSRHQWAAHYMTSAMLTPDKLKSIRSHFPIGDRGSVHGIVFFRKFKAGRDGMVVGSRGVHWKKDDYPAVSWSWSELRNAELEVRDRQITARGALLLEGPAEYLSIAMKVLDDIRLYLEALEADDCPIRYVYDASYSNVRAMPTVSDSGDALWLPAENGMPLTPMRTSELQWAIETGQVDWQTLMVWRRGLPGWTAAELVESFMAVIDKHSESLDD